MEDDDVLGEQIESLFHELEASTINYSDWEETFIADMHAKFEIGSSFSSAQLKQIERLYSKYIQGDENGTEPEDTYTRFQR